MAEDTARLEDALRNAAAAGDDAAATRLANELRSRRAKGGQPQAETAVPLGSDDQADPIPSPEADGFSDVPTEIAGVTLTPQMRQMFVEGRALEDPKEKRLAGARLAGRISALSDDGNLADKFARSQTGAALRGVGAGIFGLGDLAAAGGTAISSSMSFGEALEAQREFRRTLEEEFTGTSLAGEIGGALLGGGVVLKGAQALAKGTKLAAPLAKATVFTKGKGVKTTLANVARASSAGALSAGVTEEITEGEGLRGLKIGALAGPIGVGLVKAGSIPLNAAANMLRDPASKGLTAIAKKLGVKPEEMAQRFLEFKTVTGKTPAIADIANPQAAAELRQLISERASSVAIAREGAEATLRTRGGEIAEQVAGGRVTTTKRAQEAARTRLADKQFEAIKDETFQFDEDAVKTLLEDDDIVALIPKKIMRDIRDDIKAATVNGNGEGALKHPIELSGRFVDDLRQALGAAEKSGKGFPRRFRELKQQLEGMASEQSPEFGQAVKNFATRSARAKGVEAGRKVTTADTSEFRAAADAAAVPGRGGELVGQRVGARSALADVAREGASRSARLSRDLAEDSGLVARLREVLPEAEVDRLQAIGRVQARAAEGARGIAPGVKAEENKAVREAVRDAVGALVVAGGNTGGAFKAGIVQRLANRLTPKVSKKVVDNIARDVFDPAKTEQVIAALRRAELGDAEILDLFATAVASGQQAADIVGQ